ncbi:MAG: hypothetical protein MJ211_16040 [Bacteroidales bacterium]|nr:hypothetical protein [Bacteroidales bacterium]
MCIFIYVLINIILFIIYKFTYKLKTLHRFLSGIDNILFCLLLVYGFYRIEPIFVVLVPCVLLIVYPISWGLNKELSGEDVASVVELKSPFPLKKENRVKAKVGFAHVATFPFFYLLDSWKKVS